jgi:hypothetical protein
LFFGDVFSTHAMYHRGIASKILFARDKLFKPRQYFANISLRALTLRDTKRNRENWKTVKYDEEEEIETNVKTNNYMRIISEMK